MSWFFKQNKDDNDDKDDKDDKDDTDDTEKMMAEEHETDETDSGIIFVVMQDHKPLLYCQTYLEAEKNAQRIVELTKMELLSPGVSVMVDRKDDSFRVCQRNLMRILSYDELVTIIEICCVERLK